LLDRLDHEFLAMKPMAFNALCRGSTASTRALRSGPVSSGMRAAGFMQHGKGEARQGVTAEDVASKLLQLNVNVSIKPRATKPGG
jgi:hypothetical protein